jgi:transcriptional regulator with XRE-family HTH domain
MAKETESNAVKRRRAELNLTQQEAARRSEVSLATWRRFENTAGDTSALDGFRAGNLQGFARALKLSVASLKQMVGADATSGAGERPAEVDQQTTDVVRLFNRSFNGDPLTPADAMALATTVDFSDFAPTKDGRLHLDSSFSHEFRHLPQGRGDDPGRRPSVRPARAGARTGQPSLAGAHG